MRNPSESVLVGADAQGQTVYDAIVGAVGTGRCTKAAFVEAVRLAWPGVVAVAIYEPPPVEVEWTHSRWTRLRAWVCRRELPKTRLSGVGRVQAVAIGQGLVEETRDLVETALNEIRALGVVVEVLLFEGE